MTQNTVVLVTGAKAGIGKGLLKAYAQRSNTTVVAAIRDDPNSAAAKELLSLSTAKDSKIIVAQYDAGSKAAAEGLTTYLENEHHIDRLDIVVANAGILHHYGPAKNVTPEELQEHLMVNTIAPILLYQGTATLLNRSEKEPKFFIISSTIGSNALMNEYPMPMIAYGLSKAAVNFAAGRIHREEERIIVVPVQPGWTHTAMGEKAAVWAGMEAKDVPIALDDSVHGLMKVFDSATKAESSGRFWDQNGKEVPW